MFQCPTFTVQGPAFPGFYAPTALCSQESIFAVCRSQISPNNSDLVRFNHLYIAYWCLCLTLCVERDLCPFIIFVLWCLQCPTCIHCSQGSVLIRVSVPRTFTGISVSRVLCSQCSLVSGAGSFRALMHPLFSYQLIILACTSGGTSATLRQS